MKTPFLIFIDGPMGSGKTTTTKLLNQKLPDTARIAMPDVKRLVPNYKENPNHLVVIRAVMAAMIDTYLANGVSVIVEQVATAEGLEKLKDITEKRDAKFFAYRLSAPKDTRKVRVDERTKVDMGVTELPQDKVEQLAGYFEPNDQFYIDNPTNLSEPIDTGKMNPDEVTNFIISKLSTLPDRV